MNVPFPTIAKLFCWVILAVGWSRQLHAADPESYTGWVIITTESDKSGSSLWDAIPQSHRVEAQVFADGHFRVEAHLSVVNPYNQFSMRMLGSIAPDGTCTVKLDPSDDAFPASFTREGATLTIKHTCRVKI